MLYVINGIALYFWIKLNDDETQSTIMVRKAEDNRSLELPFSNGGAEVYPVVTISHTGECWRHPGLPTNWGFRLTADRKIKEIR